jgi:hypothetical protein
MVKDRILDPRCGRTAHENHLIEARGRTRQSARELAPRVLGLSLPPWRRRGSRRFFGHAEFRRDAGRHQTHRGICVPAAATIR